jgi:hypothetical protein
MHDTQSPKVFIKTNSFITHIFLPTIQALRREEGRSPRGRSQEPRNHDLGCWGGNRYNGLSH